MRLEPRRQDQNKKQVPRTYYDAFLAFLRRHPHAPGYRNRFPELVRKELNGWRKENAFILLAWKLGIAEDITDQRQLTMAFAHGATRRLYHAHESTRQHAEWTVATWCACYGAGILHRTCDEDLIELAKLPFGFVEKQTGAAGSAANIGQFRYESDAGRRIITGCVGNPPATLVIPERLNNMPVRSVAPGAFAGAEIQHVILREGIESIGEGAFEHCGRLRQVVFPSTLMSIDDYAFRSCEFLHAADLPEGLRRIGTGAFAGSGILEAIIPDSVRDLGEGAFEDCEDLENADIGLGIMTIPADLFANCTSLQDLHMSVRVERIEKEAFEGCVSLEEVAIPDACRFIGDGAFANMGPNFSLFGRKGGAAEYYANRHNIPIRRTL